MSVAAQLLTAADQKRLSTLQAAAALSDIVVVLIEADNGRPAFIVSKWSLTRHIGGLDELAELLSRMGVRA